METLLADRDNDAILVMNVPTALASASDAAKAVAAAVRENRNRFVPPKPVFAVWVGDDGEAAAELEAAGIPHYPSESDAVRGFMHLVRYREAIDHLMATPPSLPQDFTPDVTRRAGSSTAPSPRAAPGSIRSRCRGCLRPIRFPSRRAILARNADEAAAAAAPLLAGGGTVAVKILSPDIVHKSDVGGVRLNLTSEQARARSDRRRAGAGASRQARRAHHRRHDPSHDRAAEGPRTDRRHRRRSDFRADRGLRQRRHRGRGHRRQGDRRCRRST